MEEDGSGEGAGDNDCEDGTDETGVAEVREIVCSDDKPKVEGKGWGHSGSEEWIR